jgi:hypothetical protein
MNCGRFAPSIGTIQNNRDSWHDSAITRGRASLLCPAIDRALADPGCAPAIPARKEEQFAFLRAAFIPWLARIDPETGVPMRRMARINEIPEGSRAIVERLVEARLLVSDRRSGFDVIEVAHESLLRQWPALTAWLQADADDLKIVEGIERAVSEWARNGRNDTWLDHRAERLTAAERIARREDFRRRLGEDGDAYLSVCRARERKARAPQVAERFGREHLVVERALKPGDAL